MDEGVDGVRVFLVDTPAGEFSAAWGAETSGRTSGVSPVCGGIIPPSGVLCASSMVLLFSSISMILTYPTQGLIKKIKAVYLRNPP